MMTPTNGLASHETRPMGGVITVHKLKIIITGLKITRGSAITCGLHGSLSVEILTTSVTTGRKKSDLEI